MGSLQVQEQIYVTVTGLSDICSNRSKTFGGVGVMEGVYGRGRRLNASPLAWADENLNKIE